MKRPARSKWVKVPRMGPEWSRLCDTIGKLAASDAALDAADRSWLLELLAAIQCGDDVSKRFVRKAKPSPNAERDFWIAVDVAQHIHDQRRPARDLVASRWSVSVDVVQAIVKRKRADTNKVMHLLGDGMARMIEWHRETPPAQ